ncbi:hypothetical protein [Saccharibacillus deserti]|uniref:hypothetical protein n=1 Tax=Saccharibacillus deserti TaxID=1634444 RepID=UPI001555085F|nr:hypothetical protein [Saccharibacillus deserti]
MPKIEKHGWYIVRPEIKEMWQQRYPNIKMADYKIRGIYFAEKANEESLISEDHKLSFFFLYGSCEKRIQACSKKSDKYYSGMQCDWNDPFVMSLDLLNEPSFWNEWVRLSNIFESNSCAHPKRPSIDRIDSNIGYALSNLRPLTLSENTRTATAKPNYIINLSKMEVTKFPQKQKAEEHIGKYLISDNGRPFMFGEDMCVLQSEKALSGEKRIKEKVASKRSRKTTILNLETSLNGFPALLKIPISFDQVTVEIPDLKDKNNKN